ncbi:MAG: hypothetical protein CMJ32_10545 [Phycisphaerae bacterium]|nr:hypothetical protein [Phycisphaerae bacterium]
MEDRPASEPGHVAPDHMEWLRSVTRVLRQYDIGGIGSITEFKRGSRKSPKLLIRTERGSLLLKQRARGRFDEERIRMSHEFQFHLGDNGFPVAPLVRTMDGRSWVHENELVFELFRFIDGGRCDKSPAQTEIAGEILGRLHSLSVTSPISSDSQHSSFHDSGMLEPAIGRLASSILKVEPGTDPTRIESVALDMMSLYRESVAHVSELGFDSWDRSVIHGDWHPGNLIFIDGKVIAVIDFDTIREEPLVIDLANGALQFSSSSIRGASPLSWPVSIDLERMAAFIRGYRESGSPLQDTAFLRAIPWLMIEALIIEAVVPIAQEGRFADISGWSFLVMAHQRARWIHTRIQRITEILRT